MPKLLSFSFCFLFVLTGCIGGTASIQPNMVPEILFNSKNDSSVSFQVAIDGQNQFEGYPSGVGGFAYGARVDLKQIQEIVANKILKSMYTDVNNNLGLSDINLTSKISDFSYKFLIPFDMFYPRVMVSFKMDILAKDKENNIIYSNTIKVIDSLGSSKEMFDFLGISIQYNANKTSQLVTDTVLKKIYDIYLAEFQSIAQIPIKNRVQNTLQEKLEQGENIVLAIVVEKINNPELLRQNVSSEIFKSWADGIESTIINRETEALLRGLNKYNNFSIVERRSINKIENEYVLQMTGYTRTIDTYKMGEFLNATHILILTFNRNPINNKFYGFLDEVQGRLVSVKDARILAQSRRINYLPK